MDLNELEKLFLQRQSCREFSPQEIPEELVKEVCRLALLSPSACNAQPWKLIAVMGEKKNAVAKTLQDLGMNKFASVAPVLIAVCEGKSTLSAKVGARFKDSDFTANDLGILTAHLILAAEAAGLSTCILGWRNEKALRAALGLSDKTRVPHVVALGYAAEGYPVRPKNRKPTEDTFTLIK